jgi:hypothetical protein
MTTPKSRVTRDDIEAKLRQLQGDVEHGMDAGREAGKFAALAGGTLAMAVVYLVGRRHGRKKRTVVEIKRF